MTPDRPASNQADVSGFAAVVTAAGTGQRMGGRKKPFLEIGGKTILDRALEAIRRAGGCRQIVLVLHETDYADESLAEYLNVSREQVDVVPGGDTRQRSACRGIEAVRDDLPLVLIHDAVRPLVDPTVIRRVAVAAHERGAAIAAVPATETVKRADAEGLILDTPPRDELWYARTPQGFHLDLIRRAHRRARQEGFEGTDDAQLVERLGHPVYVVQDRYENIKITTEQDLAIAEAILRWKQSRPVPDQSDGPRQTRRDSS